VPAPITLTASVVSSNFDTLNEVGIGDMFITLPVTVRQPLSSSPSSLLLLYWSPAVRNCGRVQSLGTNASAVVENGVGTATLMSKPL